MAWNVDLRGVARALYDYRAYNPRELSFFKGDLIKIRKIIDRNWYHGEMNGGLAGLVPANYVELAAVAEEDTGMRFTEVTETHEGQARALYHFDARDIKELPLVKGELLHLTRRVDYMWWEGRNQYGRKGLFPANYVFVIREPYVTQREFVSGARRW